MSAKPSISVVLIVFNGENFLAEAIESVVNQSLEDWELVVADDGSTDGTSDILRRYQEQLGSKMIICRHPGGQNRGMSAARNLGVEHASSDVVTFLDHDHGKLLFLYGPWGATSIGWNAINGFNLGEFKPCIRLQFHK